MSNTKEKAPINWHFTCQLTLIYENFKEWYFSSTQNTSWLFERCRCLILMIQNDTKEKVNDLVRFQELLQEKLRTTSYSEQVLTLVPDKWSWMYCSEYFNIFEYLVWTSHEIKKVGGILAKPAPKKRKNYHHWNIPSGKKRLWGWKFQ